MLNPGQRKKKSWIKSQTSKPNLEVSQILELTSVRQQHVLYVTRPGNIQLRHSNEIVRQVLLLQTFRLDVAADWTILRQLVPIIIAAIFLINSALERPFVELEPTNQETKISRKIQLHASFNFSDIHSDVPMILFITKITSHFKPKTIQEFNQLSIPISEFLFWTTKMLKSKLMKHFQTF